MISKATAGQKARLMISTEERPLAAMSVKNQQNARESSPLRPEGRFSHRFGGAGSAEDVAAGIFGHRAQLLLDADQLVVLGETVGAGERAGLDLPAIGGDGEVGDGRVLGLAGAVRH